MESHKGPITKKADFCLQYAKPDTSKKPIFPLQVLFKTLCQFGPRSETFVVNLCYTERESLSFIIKMKRRGKDKHQL